MLITTKAVGHTIRQGACKRTRSTHSSVLGLVWYSWNGKSDIHQAQYPNMLQGTKISQMPSFANIRPISIWKVWLDFQSFVTREIEILQVRIEIPIPVIRPVGHIILQRVTTTIENS